MNENTHTLRHLPKKELKYSDLTSPVLLRFRCTRFGLLTLQLPFVDMARAVTIPFSPAFHRSPGGPCWRAFAHQAARKRDFGPEPSCHRVVDAVDTGAST